MKRGLILIILFLVHMSFACGQKLKWNQAYQNYIDQYKNLAIREMLRWHIPASITLAQGVLESRAGMSDLVIQGNNHFGIKCHGWTGRTTYHDDDAQGECFRAYDDAMQSYEDHSKFLANGSRYRSLFSLSQTDYRGWAWGLKKAGYATNPNYARLLIGIIETYNLSQYDRARSFDHFIVRHSGTDRKEKPGIRLHLIGISNKNYYVIARSGDTFKSIAREIGISYRKLAKYNERNRKDTLTAGEIVWLKKKRSKAEKQYKKRPHVVAAGESMYSIAQKYGIRLKSLYKKNNLEPNYQIRVGDRLRVY